MHFEDGSIIKKIRDPPSSQTLARSNELKVLLFEKNVKVRNS
jgi:hypothetical protein